MASTCTSWSRRPHRSLRVAPILVDRPHNSIIARPGACETTAFMSDIIKLRDGVEWRHVEEQILALDTNSSTFFNTNRAGAVLWSALSAGRTREQLADSLAAEYKIDLPTARRDVDAFLGVLARHSLLA